MVVQFMSLIFQADMDKHYSHSLVQLKQVKLFNTWKKTGWNKQNIEHSLSWLFFSTFILKSNLENGWKFLLKHPTITLSSFSSGIWKALRHVDIKVLRRIKMLTLDLNTLLTIWHYANIKWQFKWWKCLSVS